MERKIRYRGKNQNCAGRPKKSYEPLDEELRRSIQDYYVQQLPMINNYCWAYSTMFRNVTQSDILSYFDELLVVHIAGTRKPIDKFGYVELTKIIFKSVISDLSNRKWYTSYLFDGESSEIGDEDEYLSIFDKKVCEINLVEHIMENEHNKFIIDKMMSCLNEQEKEFIKYYFTDECRQNSAEVGRKFGCTRQNADYIIKRVLRNLSVELKKIMF